MMKEESSYTDRDREENRGKMADWVHSLVLGNRDRRPPYFFLRYDKTNTNISNMNIQTNTNCQAQLSTETKKKLFSIILIKRRNLPQG